MVTDDCVTQTVIKLGNQDIFSLNDLYVHMMPHLPIQLSLYTSSS
jgi:hypothetical protein